MLRLIYLIFHTLRDIVTGRVSVMKHNPQRSSLPTF